MKSKPKLAVFAVINTSASEFSKLKMPPLDFTAMNDATARSQRIKVKVHQREKFFSKFL